MRTPELMKSKVIEAKVFESCEASKSLFGEVKFYPKTIEELKVKPKDEVQVRKIEKGLRVGIVPTDSTLKGFRLNNRYGFLVCSSRKLIDEGIKPGTYELKRNSFCEIQGIQWYEFEKV